MAKLVEVLARELSEWPENITKFTCDPEGEVRGHPFTEHDFYPDEEVDASDRTKNLAGLGDDLPAVTRAMWQSERDRKKGGEWKRHRGGRQPVDGTEYVEVRLRDGDIQKSYAHCFAWPYYACDHSANIMAYRVLEKPEREEKEVKAVEHKFKVGDKVKVTTKDEGEWCNIGNIHTVRVLKECQKDGLVYVVDQDNECAWIRECNLELVEPSVSVGTLTYTIDLNTEPAMQKIEELQAKWDQFDGPLKWRDGVAELEAYIEEFARQRDELVKQLEGEGFSLIPHNTPVQGLTDQVDMQDWRNWKVGDIIVVIRTSQSSGAAIGEYLVTGIDYDDERQPIELANIYFPLVSDLKFIRRP